MSDINDLLADDGQRWRTQVDQILVSEPPGQAYRVPALDAPTPRRALLAPALAAAAVLAVLAGLWIFGVAPNSPDTPSRQQLEQGPRPRPRPRPTPTHGSGTSAPVVTPAGLSLQLHLDRSVAPADGRPIHGYVILNNDTGAPVNISDACDGWLEVGLVNAHTAFHLYNQLVVCPGKHLPIGRSRHSVTVSTGYQECREPNGTKGSGPIIIPECVGPSHNQQPTLPPGRYRTKIGVQNVSRKLSLPPSMTVILTRP